MKKLKLHDEIKMVLSEYINNNNPPRNYKDISLVPKVNKSRYKPVVRKYHYSVNGVIYKTIVDIANEYNIPYQTASYYLRSDSPNWKTWVKTKN